MIDTLAEAIRLAGGEQALVDLINLHMPSGVLEEPEQSDRLRLVLDMLEQYHLCRVNLAIREAILKRLIEKGAGQRVEAQALMMTARGELANVEMTITELMGVDS